MNEKFAFIDALGELFYHEIYLFYDEPLLFSCMNNALQYYMFERVPSVKGQERWVAVSISQARLLQLEKNTLEVRDVFVMCETGMAYLITSFEGLFSMETIMSNSLSDDMLPMSGEYLDFDRDDENDIDALPNDGGTPLALAEKERRDVLELSLEMENRHKREISSTALGHILENTQQLVFALANKNGGLRGAIPSEIQEGNTLLVSGVFAASFGIRLKSKDVCSLLGETAVTKTLSELSRLLDGTHNREVLQSVLESNSPRVMIKYRELLQTLLRHKMALRVHYASPNKTVYNRRFAMEDISQYLKVLDTELQQRVVKETLYGNLVSIDNENHKFGFRSAGNDKFKGKLAPSLQGKTFSVTMPGKAVIETQIQFDEITGTERFNHTLIDFNGTEDE